MRLFFLSITLIIFSFTNYAQQANFNGTGTAPDFTLTDISGINHNLYSYLDSGKTVVLKFMNVFCGACGSHATPTEDFWNIYGPDGSDQVMVLGLEINSTSDSLDCINYINNYNISHPFINNASSYPMGYAVNYTPTFYVIYPDYTYDAVCLGCTYSTSPSTIEATLSNLVNSWTPPVNDLIISEYSEGSSYNKYIELYNGTAYDVDLSDYEIWKISNGGLWPETSLSLSGFLASGETYVIAHPSSSNDILSASDLTSGICNFNGDDAVGLAKIDTNNIFTLIDAVGEDGSDPGSGWTVSGVSNGTKDRTLIRFSNICNPEIDWTVSSSQWEVLPQNTWSNIGVHSGCLNSIPPIFGCTNPQAANYDSTATEDDGSCILPSIVINNPNDNAILSDSVISISFIVSNFRVGLPGPLVDGHIHFYINGSMVMHYDTSSIQLNLPSGTHTFIIELVDNNHQPFSPSISDTITFTNGINVYGCTDSDAFNYNPNANIDDGSCYFIQPISHTINTVGMFFDPDTLYVTVGDTVIFNIGNLHNAVEVDSSTYVANGATSNGGFSFGVGTFEWIVPQVQTYYYVCQPHAMMAMKGIIVAGMPISQIFGCTDINACNYDSIATDDDGSCLYSQQYYDCYGNCINDIDNNGVCDELDIYGCMDISACNYNSSATISDTSCIYPIPLYDCFGNCWDDIDNDGICDALEISGCTDTLANNYNPSATDDDGSCSYCSSFTLSIYSQSDASTFGASDGTAVVLLWNLTIQYYLASESTTYLQVLIL